MLWNDGIIVDRRDTSRDTKETTLPVFAFGDMTGFAEEDGFRGEKTSTVTEQYSAGQDWGGLYAAWEKLGINPSSSDDHFDTVKPFEKE